MWSVFLISIHGCLIKVRAYNKKINKTKKHLKTTKKPSKTTFLQEFQTKKTMTNIGKIYSLAFPKPFPVMVASCHIIKEPESSER